VASVDTGKAAVPSSRGLKDVVTEGITNAKDQAELDKILRLASNRIPPDELTAILDHTLTDGTKVRDIENNPKYANEYELKGDMKRNNKVTDKQVEEIWLGMSGEQKALLVPRGAGAPDRIIKGQPPSPSYIETDWGTTDKDVERMRKSMLKAMLEQIDANGDIIDPWTGKPLEFPADLDHIVPLAKGGGHGGKTGRVVNAGINSENWVWIKPEINRNYKGDGDLQETVASMASEERENLRTNGQSYRDHLDKIKKEYQAGSLKDIKDKDRKKAIAAIEAYFDPTKTDASEWMELPDPDRVQGMSKPEAEVVYKALRDAKVYVTYNAKGKPLAPQGLVPKGQGMEDFKKALDDKQYPKAVAELYRAVHETQESALAKVKIDKLVADFLANPANQNKPIPVFKIPTNTAVDGILKNDDPETLSPKQVHRVIDKFIGTYPDPANDKSLPDDIRAIYSEALATPLSNKDKSGNNWALPRYNAKIPDFRKLDAAKREKLYKYLQETMSKPKTS
jgi:hypothetical protein